MRFHIIEDLNKSNNAMKFCNLMHTNNNHLVMNELNRHKTIHHIIYYGSFHDDIKANEYVKLDSNIHEIIIRKQYGDIIVCFGKDDYLNIKNAFNKDCSIVECGINYKINNPLTQFKIFESYASMNHNYGLNKIDHPSWYDAVIYPYVDDIEFVPSKENYYVCFAEESDLIVDCAKKDGI